MLAAVLDRRGELQQFVVGAPERAVPTSVARPAVSVPVLSKTMVSSRWARSRDSTSLIRMPARAAAPVPVMMAVGVARPRAQGQAITSTATAEMKACSKLPVTANQPMKVMTASATTTGTKMALIWSTRRCTGALPPWAFSTSRMIRASVESAPTAVARTSSRPVPLMAPPVTLLPGCLSTGRLSPVISDSSSSLRPATTSPSTGMRSPGRTITRSPARTSLIGTSRSRAVRAAAGGPSGAAGPSAAGWRRSCRAWPGTRGTCRAGPA